MSTQAIEVRREAQLENWKSPMQIKARITAIQQLMESALKKDLDYGVIPGMPKGTKPSLWKPGSEQILAMFQIAVEPIVEDLSTEDCARYRVTARLTNSATGDFLGAGIGEASTNETKYKWRRTYVQKEFENTPEDRRRIKYGQRFDNGKWTDYEEMQVRQEPADLANTILKMAKKRAQIDATLTVTAASSMFEQDLEDLTDETKDEMSRQRQSRGKKAQQSKEPVGDVICSHCGEKNRHSPDCKFAVPCPECHAPVGKPHATGCSQKQTDAANTAPQDSESKPESSQTTQKWLVQVEAVDKREKVIRDDKGKEKSRTPYQMLTCINAANENITLYSWHTGETFKRLEAIKPKTHCIFMVKQQSSYWSLEEIVEITGEKFKGELIPPK